MRKTLLSVFSLFSMYILSAQQNVLWEKSIGGEQAEYLHHAIPTPDYGFLILGSSASDATGDKAKKNQGGLDFFIWKMNEDGKEEWQQSFGGNAMDNLYTATITPDGGYLLAGTSTSSKSGDKTEENFGNEDIWIIKISPLGNIEWQKTLGGNGNDIPVTIIKTKDNGYLIGANSNSTPDKLKTSPSLGGNDYWVIKLNQKGEVEWENTYGGENNDQLKSITETEKGYIVIGNSNSPANDTSKILDHNFTSNWSILIDKKGEPVDELIFSDKENRFVSFQQIEKSYYLTIQETSKKDKLSVIQLDENFNKVSSLELDFDPKLSINQINKIDNSFFTSSNLIKTTFESNNPTNLSSQYVSKAFDEKGNEIWSKNFGDKGFNYLENTLITRDGSLVLFGNSTQASKGSNGQSDFYIIKLGNEKSDDDIKRVSIEAYPNPTQDVVNVLINKDFKKASIDVYNLTGQHLQTKEVKYRSTPISLGDYPAGVYILKINHDNQTESIKIIKK